MKKPKTNTTTMALSLEQAVAFLHAQMPPDIAAGFCLAAAVDAAKAADWSDEDFFKAIAICRRQSAMPDHVNVWIPETFLPKTKA